MIELGERIRIARIHSSLTQEELAEIIGVSRGSIARYESGEIEPKIGHLLSLSRVLNVSVDYLLGVDRDARLLADVLSEKALSSLKSFVDEVINTAKERQEEK